MPAPRMVIVAGPPGGGKSSVFSIFKLGIVAFSTDSRAGELLGQATQAPGPIFQPLPDQMPMYLEFRRQAGAELEQFIGEHIQARKSFAFETSLRDVTFDQAHIANGAGFFVQMLLFVAGGDKHEHADRVMERGAKGGHIASLSALHAIYERSMGYLPKAFEENRLGHIDQLSIFHNPRTDPVVKPEPVEVATLDRGTPTHLAEYAPAWFHGAMRGTEYTFGHLHDLYLDRGFSR